MRVETDLKLGFKPVEPIFDLVMLSARVHVYVSQSDRGEIVVGGGADVFNSFAQRGSLAALGRPGAGNGGFVPQSGSPGR